MAKEKEDKEVTLSSPRLDALEKLYVRTYLSTLSHAKAYERVVPGLKHYHNDNPYSRRTNVSFHISLKMQEASEAISITPETIITNLYKEAIREGPGSNHLARIQALQILGKHLGLFEEKKQDGAHVINIVNYSPTPLSLLPEETIEKEVEEIDEVPLLNIDIIDY